MVTSTDRVRAWRKANPEKALALLRAQQEREGDKIRARAKKWSEDNPERRKQIKADFDERRRTDIDTWAKHMVSSIKSRCKKRGITCSLVKQDLIDALPPDGCCPIFGTQLLFGGVNGTVSPNSPSVDRLLPHLGYTRGNIRIISARANMIKQDVVDPNELRKVADYMERELGNCALTVVV